MFAPSLKLIATTTVQVKSYARSKKFFWKMREVGPFLKSAHILYLKKYEVSKNGGLATI